MLNFNDLIKKNSESNFAKLTKSLSHSDVYDMDKKDDWKIFEKELLKHNITALYHFTDKENLQSIIDNGGLYSWKDAEEKGIAISKPGGSIDSHNLDRKKGLENYVRLSLVKEHPMKYVAKDENRQQQQVILVLAPELVFLKETKFSDKNAAARKYSVRIGPSIEDFRALHFDLFNQSYFDLSEEDQQFFQAEVLVKNFIPLKYILNIESVAKSLGISIPADAYNITFHSKNASSKRSEGFTKLAISDSVTYIDNRVLYDCYFSMPKDYRSLRKIIIPNSVTYIGEHAFEKCFSLKEIIIPNSVTGIGWEAFFIYLLLLCS